jgi:hypothetical protein
MVVQVHEGQLVKIVGTKFGGCVGTIRAVLVGHPGDDLSVTVTIRISLVGPDVAPSMALSPGESIVVPAFCVKPAR